MEDVNRAVLESPPFVASLILGGIALLFILVSGYGSDE